METAKGSLTPNWKSSLWFKGPSFVTYRQGRFVILEFSEPHRVMTTSSCMGGLSTGIKYLVNHQSCEAAEHKDRYLEIAGLGLEGYHHSVCSELRLSPVETAVMGTAANVIYAAHEEGVFGELRVDTIVTAGVEGNASCAGDPAEWIETPSGWNKQPNVAGTINTMVMVNQPLTPEALVRTLLTITEGKTAALMELGISSRYSQDLATGTGTDQICVAAPVDASRYSYTSASPHTKLGELLGRTARRATANALRWQNGLEPSLTRSLPHALRRFGFSEALFVESMRSRLTESLMRLLEKNKNAILYEPQAAAAAYAFGAILDRVRFGVLPLSAGREVLRQQAATLAASLSAQIENWPRFWQQLNVTMDQPLDAVFDAVALGWAAKWESKV